MPKIGSSDLLFLKGTLIFALAAFATSMLLPTARAQPYSLAVRCVDGGDFALPNANITLTSPGNTWSDETDASGIVWFHGLLPGSYTVRAKYKDTEVSTYGPFSLDPNRLEITLNCTVYDWVITVLDAAENETIAGARVSIESLETSDSSTSDASGRARFFNMPEASYQYTVRYKGFPIASGLLYLDRQNQGNSIKTNMYDLIIGGLDVSDRPAVGVTLKLWNQTGVLVGEKQTGLDGQAKFKNLPGRIQYTAEAFFQDKSIGSLDWFTLSTDGLLKTMDLQLARLTLTVKDFNGVNVISNLNLKASVHLDGQLVVESSSTAGEIDLGSLVLETYSVNVTFENTTVASFSHALTKESQQRTVNADFYDVTARVDASELFNSAQAQNLRMRLEYGEFSEESRVGVNGEASFEDVPPARCSLKLLKGGTVIGSELVAVSSQDQSLPPIKPATYTLSVKVVHEDLEPLLCSVRLVETGGIPVSTLESNQSGVADFPRILGLTYDVTVSCKGYEVGRQNVQVFRDSFVLIVANVYRIAVTLTDYEGSTAIQGASIEATAPNLSTIEIKATDSQGKAVFQDMPSADYVLKARFMNVDVSTALVALDGNRDITFPSPGIYDMTVQCLDADGNPLKLGEAEVLLGGKEVGRERLDEEGRAQFFNLPNTTYGISASLYQQQVGAASVALNSQGQVVQLDTQASALRIKLTAADNTTIVDANVTVIRDGRRIASKTPSPTDHRTSFTLPVGSFRILVYYQDTPVSETIETHLSSRDLEIPCAVYKCQVKAIDLQHEAVQGTIIEVSKGTESVLSTTTNSTGLAEFYLAAGQHTWRIVMPGRSFSALVDTDRNLQILLLDVEDQPSLAAAATAGAAISLLLLAVSLYLRRRTKVGATGDRKKRYRPRVPRV